MTSAVHPKSVRSSMMLMVILPHSRNHLGSFLCLLMHFSTLIFLFWSVFSHYISIYYMWHGLHMLDACFLYSVTPTISFASCSSAFLYLTTG